MPASPTKLTTQLLEAAGWTVRRVDWFNMATRRTHDFLGVADLLATSPDKGLMLVQLTQGSNRVKHSNYFSRKRKVLQSADARDWVAAGGRFMVITWRPGNDGETPWVSRYEELTLADFTAADAAGATL